MDVVIAEETMTQTSLPTFVSMLADHPFTATTLNRIGTIYCKRGDYNKAIEFIERALQIRQALLGIHQETAQSHFELGVAFKGKKDYAKACEHLRTAADIQVQVSDVDDATARSRQELAIVMKALEGAKEEQMKEE